MACVNLPAFPLQQLIQRHPDWRDIPAAVVDKDTPMGVIQWVNSRARRRRILPGMRYASGLSLAADLRAGVVSSDDIEKSIAAITERLRFFTPDVEPSRTEPGVFWLNASGLLLLYPSLKKWAGLIVSEISKAGYQASVAVGFSRYGTYAAARASKTITVFNELDDERTHARSVPIVRLGFDPGLRDALSQLGITTLGGFVDLPPDGIRKRFGEDAERLYKLARDELFTPLDSMPPVETFTASIALDYPEKHLERLMSIVETQLDAVIASLTEKNKLLAALTITLVLDCGERKSERLRPASATTDAARILDLIRLRLEKTPLPSGVVDLRIDADAVKAKSRQLELFRKRPKRDFDAAGLAFARLRAEFGDHAVMKARLRDAHLPEARFVWEPMERLAKPSPRRVAVRPLVRRIFAKSIALLSRSHHSDKDRFIPGIPDGPVRELVGPYVISGGWWLRRVHREYYFARTATNRWLWIYYDRLRRRFYLQGEVG